jgi:hypothetical protein
MSAESAQSLPDGDGPAAEGWRDPGAGRMDAYGRACGAVFAGWLPERWRW